MCPKRKVYKRTQSNTTTSCTSSTNTRSLQEITSHLSYLIWGVISPFRLLWSTSVSRTWSSMSHRRAWIVMRMICRAAAHLSSVNSQSSHWTLRLSTLFRTVSLVAILTTRITLTCPTDEAQRRETPPTTLFLAREAGRCHSLQKTRPNRTWIACSTKAASYKSRRVRATWSHRSKTMQTMTMSADRYAKLTTLRPLLGQWIKRKPSKLSTTTK